MSEGSSTSDARDGEELPPPPSASSPTAASIAPALFELIGRGLASDADDAARTEARDAWAAYVPVATAMLPIVARVLAGDATRPTVAPAQLAPVPALVAASPVQSPATPVAAVARVISQMTPDQLLDALIQRVRAALGPNANVAVPRGYQVPLVPVPPVPQR